VPSSRLLLSVQDDAHVRVSLAGAKAYLPSGALTEGAPIALLAIDLAQRLRIRVNGSVELHDDAGFAVSIRQYYWNCAKFIHPRALQPVPAQLPVGTPVRIANDLDASDRALIASADTVFVASANMATAIASAAGVDISHRGGQAGFVHVEDTRTLVMPDYRGNGFFNTLGNLSANGRAGLLFIDFATRDVVQIAADAELVWDPEEVSRFEGAERLTRFHVREIRRFAPSFPFLIVDGAVAR
jgi:hypothetical protein